VRAILGDDSPPVFSKGRQFYNVDRWVWRIFPGKMFTWARANPGKTPTKEDVRGWVQATNSTAWPERAIYIASTPDELDWTTARALTGGVYHECFHTRLSRRENLSFDEVYDAISDRWDKADWSVVGATAEEALQYIEDVRIEQCGTDLHTGTYLPLCDLQDYILDMEKEGLQARMHEQAEQGDDAPPWSELSTLMASFRDLGLGYDTAMGQEAIDRYRSMHPDVLEMVETGPVAPLVAQAASMGPQDGLGCIWLAMDLVILVQQMATTEAKSEQEQKQKAAAQVLMVLLGEGGEPGGKIPGMLRASDVLEQAVASFLQSQSDDLPEGEQPWRPYDPSRDLVSEAGLWSGDRSGEAQAMLDEVLSEVLFLRARLHQVVRTVSMTGTEHGVRRGRRLSERNLVESHIALMNRQVPTRAFIEEDEEIDTSLAAAVVLDQSSSMSNKLAVATKTMIAITEPLDTLRYPVMVVGFRDRDGEVRSPGIGWEQDYHRLTGIHYDVFKRFDERFRDVLPRFAHVKAEKMTPMSDGIQYGLNGLRTRREHHRVLFVVTDGYPTGLHARVVRWQIRTARREGIYIVGVGVGKGSQGVMSLFPDHVYAEDLEEMPEMLLHKLNSLLDFRKITRLTA
jgi:hypothetical protein